MNRDHTKRNFRNSVAQMSRADLQQGPSQLGIPNETGDSRSSFLFPFMMEQFQWQWLHFSPLQLCGLDRKELYPA